jgi:hypothetical protein
MARISLVAALAVTGALFGASLPPVDAIAQTDKPAVTKPAMKKQAMMATHHKHKWTCYDYAWESQDQKNCLARQAEQQQRHEQMMQQRGKKKMG